MSLNLMAAAVIKQRDYMVSCTFLLFIFLYMYFAHALVCNDISMIWEAMIYVIHVAWHKLTEWMLCCNLSECSHNNIY